MSDISRSLFYRLRKTTRRLLLLSRTLEYFLPTLHFTLTDPTIRLTLHITQIRTLLFSSFIFSAALFYVSLLFKMSFYLATPEGVWSALLDVLAIGAGSLGNREIGEFVEGMRRVLKGEGEGVMGLLGGLGVMPVKKAAGVTGEGGAAAPERQETVVGIVYYDVPPAEDVE